MHPKFINKQTLVVLTVLTVRCYWYNVKPRTRNSGTRNPGVSREHQGATEYGTPAEQRNSGGTTEHHRKPAERPGIPMEHQRSTNGTTNQKQRNHTKQ